MENDGINNYLYLSFYFIRALNCFGVAYSLTVVARECSSKAYYQLGCKLRDAELFIAAGMIKSVNLD